MTLLKFCYKKIRNINQPPSFNIILRVWEFRQFITNVSLVLIYINLIGKHQDKHYDFKRLKNWNAKVIPITVQFRGKQIITAMYPSRLPYGAVVFYRRAEINVRLAGVQRWFILDVRQGNELRRLRCKSPNVRAESIALMLYQCVFLEVFCDCWFLRLSGYFRYIYQLLLYLCNFSNT